MNGNCTIHHTVTVVALVDRPSGGHYSRTPCVVEVRGERRVFGLRDDPGRRLGEVEWRRSQDSMLLIDPPVRVDVFSLTSELPTRWMALWIGRDWVARACACGVRPRIDFDCWSHDEGRWTVTSPQIGYRLQYRWLVRAFNRFREEFDADSITAVAEEIPRLMVQCLPDAELTYAAQWALAWARGHGDVLLERQAQYHADGLRERHLSLLRGD